MRVQGHGIFPAVALVVVLISPAARATEPSPLLDAMRTELDRSMGALQAADEVPLYYLSYQVTEQTRYSLSAGYGAITDSSREHSRLLDISCRVGDHTLDNTHEIRGDYDFSWYWSARAATLPLTDDELAIRTIIWEKTDEAYKQALERYTKVRTNEQVLAEKEDTSDDFSREDAHVSIGAVTDVPLRFDRWVARLERWSAVFKAYPSVERSQVDVSVLNDNRYFVDSDGSTLQSGQSYARLIIRCSGTAADGMQLDRTESFDAATPDGFPADTVVEAAIQRLVHELEVLLEAPLAEPYAGPAILVNRASGVFFHEIFGHRIEGHRQKSEEEGQTFAGKVGERILPDFISVYDDPTERDFHGISLRGYYEYDDEGVRTTRVPLVENGVLRNYLMSRSPVRDFAQSNGHGRKAPGRRVVARQGNLIVESSRTFPFNELVEMMLAECRRQDKPYGLVFYDISGGFTQTSRFGPQSFKVLPLLVYKYYADGRPPEAIRGADIVGTPLSSFERIAATGDDYAVFNGTCGAESGWVPVSAVSPSILVSLIEVEKSFKEQEKPPVLKPPYQPGRPGSFGGTEDVR